MKYGFFWWNEISDSDIRKKKFFFSETLKDVFIQLIIDNVKCNAPSENKIKMGVSVSNNEVGV